MHYGQYGADTGPPTGAPLGAGTLPAGPDLVAEARRAIAALWRHKVLIAVTVLTGAVVSALLALSMPPRYEALAQVMVGDTETTVLERQSVVSDLYATEIIVEGEAAIIRSRDLAEDVIRRSGLLYDPDVNPTLAWDAPAGKTEEAAIARMVDPYYAALTVEPSRRSRVITIRFQSESPVQAAAVANSIAQAYLDRQVRDKRAANVATVETLRTRVEQLRLDVAQREQRLAQFRAANDLPDTAGVGRVSERIALTANQLEDERTQLAASQSQHQELRRALAVDRLEVPPSLIGAGTLAALWAQRAEVQTELARVRSVFRPGHPVVARQAAQLADLQKTIHTEMRTLEQNLQAEIATARSRVETRARALDDLRQEERRLQAAQVELSALDREVAVARDVLRAFLDRAAKVQELQGTEQASSALVSAAKPPTVPVGPNRTLVLAGGTFAFGFLALLLVLWLEQTDTRLLGSTQAVAWTRLPLLGTLPEVPVDQARLVSPEDLAAVDPDSTFAETVRALALTLAAPDSTWPAGLLLVTGADQGEGRTTLAVALARSLALDGARVLLVDGNRTAPRVHAVTGVGNDFGVLDHLRDGAEIDGVIQGDPLTPLELMPLGAGARAQGWRLGEAGLRPLARALTDRYDLVVVDGPGAGNNADAAAWAAVADQVVFTVAPRRSRQGHVIEALRVLRSARAPLAGLVVNRAVHRG